MFLTYKNDYSIKKKIIVALIWSNTLYIVTTMHYIEYVTNVQYFDIIGQVLVLFGFLGLIFKSKISRSLTIGISYLVLYEFLIAYFIEEFSEIFYINNLTLFFNICILYILNTQEATELFHINKPEREKYYYLFFFIFLSIMIFIKHTFYS